eukprot:GHUV01010452.1.p1 GENE.GHUV01010452.1~~GHUV01010452.1.p1  ORF type:complete len:687 (+),score=222.48 GHUV01010452.1:318-2378(+)
MIRLLHLVGDSSKCFAQWWCLQAGSEPVCAMHACCFSIVIICCIVAAGSYINKLLPSWISHLLLALLLTLLTVRVVHRANMIYKKETAALQQLAADCAAAATHPAGAAADGTQTTTAEVDAGQKASCSGSSSAKSSMGGADGVAQLVPANTARPAERAPLRAAAAAAAVIASNMATQASSSSANRATAVGHSDWTSSSKLSATLHPAGRQQQRCQNLQLHQLQDRMYGQQQQQRSSRDGMVDDGPPPSEVECRLAYAPPGHTRKGSLELQNGWDDDWELHSNEEESSQLHVGTSQSQQAAKLAVTPQCHPSQRAFEAVDADGRSSSTESNILGGEGETVVLSSGRALSAPVDGSAVLHSPSIAVTAAAAGCGGTVGSSSISNRIRSFSAAIPIAAADARPISDARAIVQKLAHISTRTDADTSSSRVDSPFAKNQRPKSKQQPPELSVHSPELQAMLVAEAAQLPRVPVLLLFVMFIAVLLASLFSKRVKCGSVAYWLVQWAVAPALLAVWAFSRRRVLHKVALKRQAGLDFHGDIRWSRHNSIIFPAICSLAGVIAGMFGLGGAVVKTPLMLELGVQPQVTAATTQTMLLLTTAASTIVYAQLGDIPWQYAAVMMPTAFAATLAGQFAIDWVVKKLGRSSVVVIVLAAFFVVACALTFYIVIRSLRLVAADPVGTTVPGRVCASG